jgi:mannose-6-phosphate isomerase-like protein (cupin superfamily)
MPPSSETRAVNLSASCAALTAAWSPSVVADVNDMQVKVARFEGAFVWHHHDAEDELFLGVEGTFVIEFEDRPNVRVGPGELVVVPRGVRHRPVADEGPVHVALFEKSSTKRTGDA